MSPSVGEATHPGAERTSRRRVRAAALAAVLSVACPACSASGVYGGTGTLQWSGVGPQEIASHDVSFTTCSGVGADPGPGRNLVHRGEPFAALTIGDGCWIDGQDTGTGRSFVPVVGRVCRLHFAEGDWELRVTDFAAQYGLTSNLRGGARLDPDHIEITLGGEDPRTGQHAVYRFVGTAREAEPSASRCGELRQMRASVARGHSAPHFSLR